MSDDNRRLKITAGIFWAAAVLGGFVWAKTNEYGTEQAMRLIYHFVSDTPYGPLIYLSLYILRPFTLFPAMLLTIFSGSIFGFWEGLIIALVGENSSANVAYLIGRFFGGGKDAVSKGSLMKRWRPALEDHAVPTIIILRAAYLPFDPVNFACGLIALPWFKYCIASIIGLLPPMVTFVSFGASLETNKLLANLHHFDPKSLIDTQQLFISTGLLIISLLLVVIIHMRNRGKFRL